jgi:hypothetical protein
VLKVLSVPAVRFLAIGGALYILTLWLAGGRDAGSYRIVVTPGQVNAIVATFERAWRRPPMPQELRGLIDDSIKEEILFREALALGLDEHEAVVRRRLRQKMEVLATDRPDGRDEQYRALRARYTVVVAFRPPDREARR